MNQTVNTCTRRIQSMLKNLSLLFFVPVIFLSICLLPKQAFSQTGTSTWVKIGTDGRLQYTPDSKGNTLPDFSMVGYKNGDAAIPNVAVVKTLTAVSGDNLAQIQAAINEVAARPLDANGFRGAILLKAGHYDVSNTLRITASGIVIRGEGNTTTGTRINATRTAQHTLLDIAGSGSPTEVAGTRKKVTTSYVAAGAKSFNVESATGFAVGDKIILRVEPNSAWITLLDMAQYGWTPSAYNMNYLRTIIKIVGNTVTIDAPVVDPIDVTYKAAYIYNYTWTKIENIGVENIRFSSVFSSTTDENHAWTAISINRAQHCWVRNSNFYHFGYSAVYVQDFGVNVSVLNCQNLEPISQTTGGRKYSFNVNGQLTLVKDCYTNGGRHDYVTGSTTSGPNAFVKCKADNMKADIGPHHRWATGLLFDNVIGSGAQNVQNREASGSGHGWAGAQTLFWNCTSSKFIVQKPPEHLNWAIGCKGNVTDVGDWHTGNPGIWQSTGNFVPPQSLYEKQLADRLAGVPNESPTVSISSPANNTTFTTPATVTINATAADVDGTITKVEFYQGTAKLGEDLTSPYSFTWSNPATGNYSITAKATDNGNAVTTSSAVNIIVQNPAPTVSIISPANGASFTAPATVDITATASDANGSVAKVEFFQGVTKLGEDLTTPYSFSWTNVVAGSYNLTAKAIDNEGAITTSAAVSISVQSAPQCLPAIASADDGNVAANVLDNNFNTRWSANGDGQWIQFCLANTASVTGVDIAFYNGNIRRSIFDILVGTDGVNWTTVASGLQSSGTSLAFESFNFTARTAKYVRIVGHGNSSNTWNSYTEVKIKTAQPSQQITLTPLHDAYVRNGTSATTTHGTTDPAILITKLNPTTTAGNDRHTYFMFDATTVSGTITSVVLRVYGRIEDTRAINVPVRIFPVSNTTWTESAITWNNKPATGATALQTATVTDATARYYTWDITSYVQSEKAAGRNRISLAMINNLATDPRLLWNSKETGSNAPQLVITVSDPVTVRTPSEAIIESATSIASLHNYPNPCKENSTIAFNLKEAGNTMLAVYDVMGRQVAVLVNGYLIAGNHSRTFRPGNIAAGVYTLKLIHNGKTITRRLLKE